jgi:hypothetical protein
LLLLALFVKLVKSENYKTVHRLIFTIILQVALRAVVLQPGVMWVGSRDLLVVSTIVPHALVQSGAGVESYSDASSGMATIMRNEVK